MHIAAFSAGHGYGSRQTGHTDSGATSRYGIEAVLTRDFARKQAENAAAMKAKALFRDRGRYYLADDDALKFGAKTFVEFHFNAARASAHGVEVLVAKNATSAEKKLATAYSVAIAHVLGIPNRGVKEADVAVLKQHAGMASVLVEICFLTNGDDMARYKKQLAKLELACFNVYWTYVGEKPRATRPRLTWRKAYIRRYLKVM
jgi:N-acetylmuramoyl-L-alanine amidase